MDNVLGVSESTYVVKKVSFLAATAAQEAHLSLCVAVRLFVLPKLRFCHLLLVDAPKLWWWWWLWLWLLWWWWWLWR